MVDDDYTNKEDAVVDEEEAIEFNNRDHDDDDGDNEGNDGSDDNDDGGDDYIEVVATTEKKRNKGKSSMSRKRHKSKGAANTPINHDSVMLSGDGDADFEGDADAEDSNDDIDLFEEKRYEKTKTKNWMKHENGRPGRYIHPIPFTGLSEFFRPNLSDDKVKGMMDAHGDIRFHKIFEWMLSTFEGVSFYECLSARMRNYMLHSIKDKGWTPLFYRPADGKVISADDVARFFGASRLTPSAHAWNACPRMRSKTLHMSTFR
jgi:hypothetical protein